MPARAEENGAFRFLASPELGTAKQAMTKDVQAVDPSLRFHER